MYVYLTKIFIVSKRGKKSRKQRPEKKWKDNINYEKSVIKRKLGI